MQITLDHETWDVAEDARLSDVLADLGGKARKRERIVDSLNVGGRIITDRDLQPAFLAQTVAIAGPVRATTKSVAEMLRCGSESARRFADALHAEGANLLARFRVGDADLGILDQWLGGLADYVEYVEHVRAQGSGGNAPSSLTCCASELLDARRSEDMVRIADVLEYELLPRLKN